MMYRERQVLEGVILPPEIQIGQVNFVRALPCDEALFTHQKGVAEIASKIAGYFTSHEEIMAQSLPYSDTLPDPEEFLRKVDLAAQVHDIGKLYMYELVNSPKKGLTKVELDIIKYHPLIGWEILRKSGLDEIAEIVRAHHEKWNGQGYPDHLEDYAIPLEARILTVADVADALKGRRPYQQHVLKLPLPISWILAYSSMSYDPQIVRAYLKTVSVEDLGKLGTSQEKSWELVHAS